jgi:hypothetical protein
VEKELRTYQILAVDLWCSSILFISTMLTLLIFYNDFCYLLIVFSMDYFYLAISLLNPYRNLILIFFFFKS